VDDPLTRKEPNMYSHYLFLALDTARERAAEADRFRLAEAARRRGQDRRTAGIARRLIARAAVAVARLADETSVGRRGDVVVEAPRLRLRSES
jgi:hypothetical protein